MCPALHVIIVIVIVIVVFVIVSMVRSGLNNNSRCYKKFEVCVEGAEINCVKDWGKIV